MKLLLTLNILMFLFLGCWDKPDEKHSESGTKEINGTQLYYRIVGKGEPVLIIHGGPGLNHYYLFPHLQGFADNYQLFFYDQRACGQSSLDVDTNSITIDTFLKDIDALRQSFGIEKLIVMGHSWGGLLAMQYAIEYPGKVKSLILISSTGASSETNIKANQILATRFTKNDSIQRMKIINTKEFHKRDPESIEKLMKIGFKHQLHKRTLIDSIDLDLNDNYAETSKLLQYLAKDLTTYDLHSDLEAIKSPTLLIYGDYDPLTETAGKKIHQSINGSRFIILNECGHFPFIEQPGEFRKAITAFLKGTS